MSKIHVETPFFSTESKEKVLAALHTLFPSQEFVLGEGKYSFSGDRSDLKTLKDRIYQNKIRDSARAYLLGRTPFTFIISKQAAFAGRISFLEESSPMGDITVRVDGDQQDTVTWLTGKTEEPEGEEI